MLAPSTAGPRTYDLCINIAGRRLFWRNRNHGVTLGNDTIAWAMDGAANETAYGNIVAVHLDSSGQKITADRCTISFADGRGLTIVNTDPGGYRDAKRASLYRDFVRDLHARLPADRYAGIRFSAGVPPWRFWTMLLTAAIAAPAFALAGLAGYVIFHLANGLLLFVIGEYFCWTLGRRALANRPRDYTPERLPKALLE
jgi:hypothetical protein